MELDFSKLNSLYRHPQPEQEAAEAAVDTSTGYIRIDGAEVPFSAAEEQEQINTRQEPEKPLQGQTEAFPYKEAYRIAYNYHAKYHFPKTDEDWKEAARGIVEAEAECAGDSFTMGLIQDIFKQMEEDCKRWRAEHEGEW